LYIHGRTELLRIIQRKYTWYHEQDDKIKDPDFYSDKTREELCHLYIKNIFEPLLFCFKINYIFLKDNCNIKLEVFDRYLKKLGCVFFLEIYSVLLEFKYPS